MVAPINYFQQLGFGNTGQQALGVAGGLGNLRTQQLQQQGMQQQLEMAPLEQQRRMMLAQQEQQKLHQQQMTQRLGRGAGLFYNAVSTGNTDGALKIAQEYAQDIAQLDPSFTPEAVAQMMQTEEGRAQLAQESLGLVQMLGGAEQFARFTAQQARPQEPSEIERFNELNAQYEQVLREQGPEAAARFASLSKLSSRPVSEVNVNLPADKQDVKIAELDAQAFAGYQTKQKQARQELNTLSALKSLSERAMSGTGANVLLGGAKLLNKLGFETDGLTESEVFNMMSNSLVLDKSQQLSGALSDGDMQFLKDTVPGLTTTKEGRRLQLEMAERLARREIQVAEQATIFRREAKKQGREFDDAEFQMYINAWADENPLFEGLQAERPQAPAAAIEFLRANPHTRDAFMQKYGYLPEGFN